MEKPSIQNMIKLKVTILFVYDASPPTSNGAESNLNGFCSELVSRENKRKMNQPRHSSFLLNTFVDIFSFPMPSIIQRGTS